MTARQLSSGASNAAKVFRPEHIIVIATQLRRLKDLARIEQLMEQADIDKNLLERILKRHKLSLPKR